MRQGYVQLDQQGLILWDTFTETLPLNGVGFIPINKTNCCEPECGRRTFDQQKDFTYTSDGSTAINFYYDALPTQFTILLNGLMNYQTGWIGLTSYQSELDAYLTAQGKPLETVSQALIPVYPLNFQANDIITVIIESLNEERYYIFDCPQIGINCVMSAWSPWTPWVNNNNGSETRTRVREIITPASGGGTPCGDTIEIETRHRDAQDCVVSDWSVWGAWEDQGNGLETRTRTRTIITPSGPDGNPCPPLTESETRKTQRDCVFSAWSDWSTWTDNGNGQEVRSRTRTIITPAEGEGQPCEPLVEYEYRTVRVPLTLTFQNPDETFHVTNTYVGDENLNIAGDATFDFGLGVSKVFAGYAEPESIFISFNHEVTSPIDGLISKITIKDLDTGLTIAEDNSDNLDNYAKILYFTGKTQINLSLTIQNNF